MWIIGPIYTKSGPVRKPSLLKAAFSCRFTLAGHGAYYVRIYCYSAEIIARREYHYLRSDNNHLVGAVGEIRNWS